MANTCVDFAFEMARRLIMDPNYAWMLASLVVHGDFVLTQLIIRSIPCKSYSL